MSVFWQCGPVSLLSQGECLSQAMYNLMMATTMAETCSCQLPSTIQLHNNNNIVVFDYFIHSLYTVINTQRGCHTLKKKKNETFLRDCYTCPLVEVTKKYEGNRLLERDAVHCHRHVQSFEQKSIGLKFSKFRTGSDVRYNCHHNSSRFTFPIFAHSWRFCVFHSLNQSRRVYINRRQQYICLI